MKSQYFKAARARLFLALLGYLAVLLGSANVQAEPSSSRPSNYLIGSGLYDITGPAADLMMAGYVDPKQTTAGIHQRLRSRAFVVAEPGTDQRVALVTADTCHIYQAIKDSVIAKLQNTYGNLYREENVLISATHTHSGPGGYSHFFLYDLATLGYSEQNFNTIADGIYRSIVRANDNLTQGTIRINSGELFDVNVNRSPAAYQMNPAAERARYAFDVDKQMTLLRFEADDGEELGALNWFAVHATSMKRDNRLISGDNKGFASYRFERSKGNRYHESRGFVAAFANSNAGDSSPNTAGPKNGKGQWYCPAGENFKCTEFSGSHQFDAARELYDNASTTLSGPIDFRHTKTDMSEVEIETQFSGLAAARTCYAAIGLSMLAGSAEDGPGVGKEGVACGTFSSVLGAIVCAVDRDAACHGVKPIVIKTGKKHPDPWTPQVLPLQIIRIGQLALAAVPGEFTTMSGRRIREDLQRVLEPTGVSNVILAGYANAYAGYVATREEYQSQHYEGGSTHFGEWTQVAYQQELRKLAENMRDGLPSAVGAQALSPRCCDQLAVHPETASDGVGEAFGTLLQKARPTYLPGSVVEVRFVGASPSHNLRLQGTFLKVERQLGETWEMIAEDGDWETRFYWERPKPFKRGTARITWEIPEAQTPGIYRIRYFGDARAQDGTLTAIEAFSNSFGVSPSTVPKVGGQSRD